MSPGRVQIRPLGGMPGCLMMILFSVVASVVLTVVVNLLIRQLRSRARAGEVPTGIWTAGPGVDAEGVLHFPGFGAEATEWLLRRRGIRALGVDTLSIDPGVSETFETHLILLGADRYGIENLDNLDRIPKRGATIMVGLIPYEEGSGGQARVFASW